MGTLMTWAKDFIHRLSPQELDKAPVTFAKPSCLAARVDSARSLRLFLDYDGTLFPIVRLPQLAAPDAGLIALLSQMVADPATEVHIVSGRRREVLDLWFQDLRVHVHAEHGAMSRRAQGTVWSSSDSRIMPDEARSAVKKVLDEYSRNAPGAFVEEKVHSLAWHYRAIDPALGEKMASELRLHARERFTPMGLEVLSGKRVVEVRMSGVNKGQPLRNSLAERGSDVVNVAIGDDLTDEDMFSALAGDGITVVVGDRPSKAQFRLRDTAAVRQFLGLLANPKREQANR